MAFDLYRSTLLVMSFIRELTMMITSSDPGPTCVKEKVLSQEGGRRRLLLVHSIVKVGSDMAELTIQRVAESMPEDERRRAHYLLDDQIDHASQVGILCLEELCDAEEHLCSLFLEVSQSC